MKKIIKGIAAVLLFCLAQKICAKSNQAYPKANSPDYTQAQVVTPSPAPKQKIVDNSQQGVLKPQGQRDWEEALAYSTAPRYKPR